MKVWREFKGGSEEQGGLGDRKRQLRAADVHELFCTITDENARLLGLNPVFARPEWFLWTVLPIGPPHIRPSVAFDAMTRAQDDITHCYAEILKANNAMANAKRAGLPEAIQREHETLLQQRCAALIDNQVRILSYCLLVVCLVLG